MGLISTPVKPWVGVTTKKWDNDPWHVWEYSDHMGLRFQDTGRQAALTQKARKCQRPGENESMNSSAKRTTRKVLIHVKNLNLLAARDL